jgi:ABC-type multidrug transport system fused ATPase/permease subunit
MIHRYRRPSVARLVASSISRGNDEIQVEYLTALDQVTSPSRRVQRIGAASLAALVHHPAHGTHARAALADVAAAAAEGRHGVSRRAAAIARASLAGLATAPPSQPPARSPLLAGTRLLAYAAGRQPRMFGAMIVGAAVFGVSAVAMAVLLNVVVGRLWLEAFRSKALDPTASALTLLIALMIFVGRAGGLVAYRLSSRVLRLRLQGATQSEVLRQYRRLPPAWHRTRPTRDLVSTADAATRAAWRPIAALPAAVGGVATAFAAISGLWILNWRLAVIGIGLLCTIATLNVLFLHIVGPHIEQATALRSEIYTIIRRAFVRRSARGAPSDEQSAAEVVDVFSQRSAQLRDVMIRVRQIRGIFMPALATAPAIASVLGLALCVAQGPSAIDQAADIISATFLFTALSSPIVATGSVLAELPNGVQSLAGIERVLRARRNDRFDGRSQFAVQGSTSSAAETPLGARNENPVPLRNGQGRRATAYSRTAAPHHHRVAEARDALGTGALRHGPIEHMLNARWVLRAGMAPATKVRTS